MDLIGPCTDYSSNNVGEGNMKIEEIIFWVVFVAGVGTVIWLIFGDTPTFEQALLMLILGVVIKNTVKLGRMESNLHHLEKKFNALAKDFKGHIKHK